MIERVEETLSAKWNCWNGNSKTLIFRAKVSFRFLTDDDRFLQKVKLRRKYQIVKVCLTEKKMREMHFAFVRIRFYHGQLKGTEEIRRFRKKNRKTIFFNDFKSHSIDRWIWKRNIEKKQQCRSTLGWLIETKFESTPSAKRWIFDPVQYPSIVGSIQYKLNVR